MSGINLASNFNPLGPPPGFAEYVREIDPGSLLRTYSGDNYGRIDISALADYVGTAPEYCIAGQGSTEFIYRLPGLLGQERVIIVKPAFWEYEEAAKFNDLDSTFLRLNDNPNDILADINNELALRGRGLVFINNPHNPSSTRVNRAELLELARNNHESDFIIDETYLQFCLDFQQATLSREASLHKNIHVVHSFSKFFSVPGIRLGLLVSDAETIREYTRAQVPYTTSPLTEKIAPWLVRQDVYIENSRIRIAAYQDAVGCILDDTLGDAITYHRPEANFAMIKFNQTTENRNLAGRLDAKGYVVRGGFEFGAEYNDCIRFALAEEDIMRSLITTIRNSYYE